MAFADLIESVDRAVQDRLGGVTAVYQPAVGDPVDVVGMFDDGYRLEDSGKAGVEQVVPAFVVRLEDLPTHPDDDDPTLTIDGTTYVVRERQTDGIAGGSVRLLLHRTGV